MFTKFESYLNEFYTGRYSAAGFKVNEPTNEYDFGIVIKYDADNENIIKGVLGKYNINYKELKLEKDVDKDDGMEVHLLDLKFLSYNRYEAHSIISSIMEELVENKIAFDPSTIKSSAIIAKPVVKGFTMEK